MKIRTLGDTKKPDRFGREFPATSILFVSIVTTVLVLFQSGISVAGELSYTCEVLGVYDLSETGILELSRYENKMKGGAFTVSRLTGQIMGEVLPTTLSKSIKVVSKGSTENAFKTIANFDQQVQILEIQEFHKGPIKPFVAMSMGGVGVVTGICK